MPLWTFTVERTWGVDALSTTTQAPYLRALVHIHAGLHGTLKAIVALAQERSRGVPACSVAADSMGDTALVDVCAVDPLLVESKSLVACASEAADAVLAAPVLAEARKIEAFIQVNGGGD